MKDNDEKKCYLLHINYEVFLTSLLVVEIEITKKGIRILFISPQIYLAILQSKKKQEKKNNEYPNLWEKEKKEKNKIFYFTLSFLIFVPIYFFLFLYNCQWWRFLRIKKYEVKKNCLHFVYIYIKIISVHTAKVSGTNKQYRWYELFTHLWKINHTII